MNRRIRTVACLVSLLALLQGGCEAFRPVAAPPPKMKAPFSHEPLNVRNGCFVESVHFYDAYMDKRWDGDQGWVRVLQWGNQDNDYKIQSGHAVAVFVNQGKLAVYDVNGGFSPLEVPVDRKGDLMDVCPPIYARYPQFKPVFGRYRDDVPRPRPPKAPEFLFYHANADVRDATRVASELGKYRPASVIAFTFMEGGREQVSAATAFVFGSRMCVYFPRGGTFVSNSLIRAVDDLRYVGVVVRRFYPTASNVRWQEGGYLLFPPAAKAPPP